MKKTDSLSYNKKTREQKNLAYYKDKLCIDGRLYSVETVEELPNDLHTKNLATRSSGDVLAFFTGVC